LLDQGGITRRRIRPDVQNQIIRLNIGNGFHCSIGIGREGFGHDHIGGNRDIGTTGLGVGQNGLGRVEQIRFVQGFANRQTDRGHERIGDATADNELIDLADQVGQQCQF